MSHPKVSVIIPVYNAEAYLAACFDRIQRQTYSAVEYIFINDGSTDDSLTLLQRAAKTQAAMTVVSQDNGGPSAARNAGLAVATGEYVMFLDSDDVFPPEYIETMVAAINDAKVDMAMSGMVLDFISEDGDVTSVVKQPEAATVLSATEVRRWVADSMATGGLFYSCWNKIYRRSVITARRLQFNEAMRSGEDLLFNLHYAEQVSSLCVIPAALYRYQRRQDGSNIMATEQHRRAAHCKELIAVTNQTFLGKDDDPVVRDFVVWLQARWLFAGCLVTAQSVRGMWARYRALREYLRGERPQYSSQTRSPQRWLIVTLLRCPRPILLTLVASAAAWYKRRHIAGFSRRSA